MTREKLTKFAYKVWKPAGTALATAICVDPFQPIVPAIWIMVVVSTLGFIAFWIFANSESLKAILFPVFTYFAFSFLFAVLFGIGQLVVPDARQKGLLASIMPDLGKAQTVVLGVCSKSDPRAYLNCRGISWTGDSFSYAVKNRDVETVELFVKGGWKLESNSMLGTLTSKDYDPVVFKPVISNKAVTSFIFCESYDGVDLNLRAVQTEIRTGADPYTRDIAEMSRRPDAFADFVAICGQQKLREFYQKKLNDNRSKRQNTNSADRPALINTCIAQMKQKLPFAKAFQQAQTFNMRDHLVLTGESSVLALINQALIMGVRATPNAIYEAALKKVCEQDTPAKQPEPSQNEKNYDEILRAIDRLSDRK